MDEKLTQTLAKIFNLKLQDIKPTLEQSQIAKWDSLTHMDLITTLEHEYSIELKMEDIVEMTSVAAIIQILTQYGVKFNA